MRPIVLAGALLAVFAGCGGGERAHEERAGLAPVERAWVRELVAWMQDVEGAAARGEDLRWRVLAREPGARRRFDSAVAPVRACAARFGEGPGRAPTDRLGRIEQLALDACEEFARAVDAEARAFTGDPGEAVATVDAAFAKGNSAWLELDRELELLATWNRPLPVVGGDRATSRIEPRFGRIASRFANRPVQVRCWSRLDWPDVFGEWQAYANDRDLLVGFVASFDRGRLSLHPTICAGLVRLAYRHVVPRGGDALLDVADAVGVFAHEIEHLVSPASEAVTECRGMQAIRELARALGATRAQAAKLAGVYWKDLYPQNTAEYRTDECRDGGTVRPRPGTSRLAVRWARFGLRRYGARGSASRSRAAGARRRGR